MCRKYFMTTERMEFSVWNKDDIRLAESLWGDPDVTRYICASGVFTGEDIAARLEREIGTMAVHGVQYWPVFLTETGELVGCCGLRPYDNDVYELGFHLRPKFWRQGYAVEAAKAVISYAFDKLNAAALFAGHNPNNTASARVLAKLGFVYTGDEYYEPTGLYHPSYRLNR